MSRNTSGGGCIEKKSVIYVVSSLQNKINFKLKSILTGNEMLIYLIGVNVDQSLAHFQIFLYTYIVHAFNTM